MINTRHGLAEWVAIVTHNDGQMELVLELIEEYIN